MRYATNTLEYQWMPFTANRAFKADPRLLVKAQGVYYWNHRGEKILDGSSGLFCTPAGHCRAEIAEAVQRQLSEMDYAVPFQLGHPGAFELARRIAALTPGDLDRVFFVNSGSEAVDTAIKIAYAYHRANGQGQRNRLVSRERAYHGVNLGGTALSGMVRNREAFGPGLPGVCHMRHTWLAENRYSRGQPEHGAELANDLQRMVDLFGAETIAACIVEPIAGSTGTLVPPKAYLEQLRAICDQHGILLIFDEVITGFGRTGQAFAGQSFGVLPDMMTMAKAITNGAQPMGAVAVSENIYNTIVDSVPESSVELFHGYTYSGHPAACAAGLAMMDILEKENLFGRAEKLADYFLDALFSLSDVPVISDIRGYGMIGGIDLSADGKPGQRGYDAQVRLFHAGLHVKFTGDAGIIAPPFVSEKQQIDDMVSILRDVLSKY